jgi:hypothetical protein
MTRRAAKVDANQPEIVDALRRAGASVRHTHMIGAGFPDIAVGYRSQTVLVEIKDGSKPPSARKLTADEARFFEEWRGAAAVVETVDDALALLKEMTK